MASFKKIVYGILLTVGFAAQSQASSVRALTEEELLNLNWLLQCPKELSQVMKKAKFILSGGVVSDRSGGTRYTYKFYRQKGFVNSEYVATLSVAQQRTDDSPSDGPGYKVSCEITVETEE